MSTYRQNLVLELAKDLKAFVNFEVTLRRTGSGEASSGTTGFSRPEVQKLRKSISERDRNIQKLKGWLAKKDASIDSLKRKLARVSREVPAPERPGSGGMRPENVVWIFGTGRGGSTWLRSMMAEIEEHRVWEEPMVGLLFGDFYNKAQKGQRQSRSFVMGDPAREGWIESIRVFLLNRAGHLYPKFGPEDYLVVKEPNGSAGAPLIMEALPESRMIFLIRDPRDVAASVIDATKSGSWMYDRKSKGDWKRDNISDTKPDVMAKRRANKYVEHVGGAKRAYDQHRGPKTLVRYEDLVEDTPGTMQRIYSELGIPVDRQELARSVEKHSWANIPEENKGEGKFYRKGSPGSWRQDLTQQQIEIVEQTTAPLLEEFYPEQGAGTSPG